MSRSIWVGLAIAAIGLPLAASTEWLQKRSTDGVYLANCYETKNSSWTSQLPYYSNALTGSQNGEFPDDNTYASTYGVVQWEGNRVCATYPDTGVQFCSSIIADTWSLPVGQFAGPGTNEYAGFNCFVDDGRLIFEDINTATGHNNTCYSRYYCFQVDQS